MSHFAPNGRNVYRDIDPPPVSCCSTCDLGYAIELSGYIQFENAYARLVGAMVREEREKAAYLESWGSGVLKRPGHEPPLPTGAD